MTDYLSKEAPRVEKMLDRFLLPMLRDDLDILSVGCGAGSDVIYLRRMGFNAQGVDPSRLSLAAVEPRYRPFLHAVSIEEYAATESAKYDFLYGLDVIEHVGCRNFGTVPDDDADEKRGRFLAACLAVLKPGGVLLLTTSNRLCPLDLGHKHKYHVLGRFTPAKDAFGLNLPWHRANFLLSSRQIRNLLEKEVGESAFHMELVETAEYPTLAGSKAALRHILRILDTRLLIGSPLAPILIVRITSGRC